MPNTCIWKCRLFMSSAEYSCKLFKPIFAYRKIEWTLIREEQSDLGPHCLQKCFFFKSQACDKADDNCCDWQFKGKYRNTHEPSALYLLNHNESMPGLPKPVQHLADYVVVFGIEVESGLTQSWKTTKLWCCQHYCLHAKRGQFTNGMLKDWTTSIQAALEYI